jgi:hypothetical protein
VFVLTVILIMQNTSVMKGLIKQVGLFVTGRRCSTRKSEYLNYTAAKPDMPGAKCIAST